MRAVRGVVVRDHHLDTNGSDSPSYQWTTLDKLDRHAVVVGTRTRIHCFNHRTKCSLAQQANLCIGTPKDVETTYATRVRVKSLNCNTYLDIVPMALQQSRELSLARLRCFAVLHATLLVGDVTLPLTCCSSIIQYKQECGCFRGGVMVGLGLGLRGEHTRRVVNRKLWSCVELYL